MWSFAGGLWLLVELSIYLRIFQMFFFYGSFCPLKKTLTSYKFYCLVVFSPAFFIAIDGTELYFFLSCFLCFRYWLLYPCLACQKFNCYLIKKYKVEILTDGWEECQLAEILIQRLRLQGRYQNTLAIININKMVSSLSNSNYFLLAKREFTSAIFKK